MKQLLIVVAALVLAAAAYFIFIKGDGGSISLTASTDKASYTVGEKVNLAVNLTNTGNSATCISRRPQGTVQFISITRDGAPVASRSARSYYITALPALVQFELAEIDTGESMDITLASADDPGLAANALSSTEVDGTAGKTTYYDISKPGAYEIEVAYQYDSGPSDTCANAFKGSTNAAKVAFTVTQ